MASNQVSQGTLNRLLSSISVIESPELNATAEYLGEGMIGLSFDGDITENFRTATGTVPSPQPFQIGVVTVNLLKTQSLSATYKSRIETNSLLGNISCVADSAAFPDTLLVNCSIVSVAPMTFNGKDPGYVVTIHGTYQINSSLYVL